MKAKYPLINSILVKSQYVFARNELEWLLKIIERSGLRDLAVFIKERNVKPLSNYPVMKKSTESRLRKYFRNEIEEIEKLMKDEGNYRKQRRNKKKIYKPANSQ